MTTGRAQEVNKEWRSISPATGGGRIGECEEVGGGCALASCDERVRGGIRQLDLGYQGLIGFIFLGQPSTILG